MMTVILEGYFSEMGLHFRGRCDIMWEGEQALILNFVTGGII